MISAFLAAAVLVGPSASFAQPADWAAAEAPFLTRPVQLTFPDRFLRAGEQYFDHQSPPQWVVFQAIERPAPGAQAESDYAMFVGRLARDGEGRVGGLEQVTRVSAPGSANTCGWFVPGGVGALVFGSTIGPPSNGESPGYSRDRQRYMWKFPLEMEVVIAHAGVIVSATPTADEALRGAAAAGRLPKPAAVFARPGYDAECSFSSDGRLLLYTHVDTTTGDPNIWVYDTKSRRHYPIVTARGYDGGPFFSPDGKWICYRSDRKGNNVLQLFIAELAYGDDGDPAVPIGITREIQLTGETDGKSENEQAVNWCPYWHPSGTYLVYASSEAGHSNYEVFAIEVDTRPAPRPREQLRRARVTHAPGFDGLPTFSDDGRLMMWCSQRGPRREGEERPSSQVWIAEVTGDPVWR